MIKHLLLVGLGGGIGSMFRYATSLLTAKHVSNSFPLSTFIVNMVGCLLMGLVIGFLTRHTEAHSGWKLLLATGFCGGYTTFSAFALENLTLLQHNQHGIFWLYLTLSILGGLFTVWLGLFITK